MEGVKQYEETLDFYKKENFNLKVRVYLLEEKIDQLYKKYAQLKDVTDASTEQKLMEEKESLAKKLQENHELLLHALDAINAMDRKTSLQDMVKEKLLQSQNEACLGVNSTKNLDSLVESSKMPKCRSIIEVISNENVIVTEYKKEIKSLRKRLDDLQEELTIEKNRNVELKKMYDSYNDFKVQLSKLVIENEEKDRINSEKDELIKGYLQQLKQFESKEFIESHKEYQRVCDLLKESTNAVIEKVQLINELTASNGALQSKVKSFEEIVSHKDNDLSILNRKYDEMLKHADLSQSKLNKFSQDFHKICTTLDEYMQKTPTLKRKRPTIIWTEKELTVNIDEFTDSIQAIVKENEKLRESCTREVENREMKIRMLEMENSRALDLIREFLIFESQMGDEKNGKKRDTKSKWVFLLQQKEQQISQLEHELTNLLKSVRMNALGERQKKDRTTSPLRPFSPPCK